MNEYENRNVETRKPINRIATPIPIDEHGNKIEEEKPIIQADPDFFKQPQKKSRDYKSIILFLLLTIIIILLCIILFIFVIPQYNDSKNLLMKLFSLRHF